MPSLNISLSPELERVVQSKIDSGMYADADEVVREAIRQMDSTEQVVYELKLARLKEALSAGLRQAEEGEFEPYELDEVLAKLNRRK